MIGQTQLLSQIDSLIENNTLPKFIVITGKKGSGKKLVAHYITTKSHSAEWIVPNNKIDTVRLLIHEVYKHINPIICILHDVDTMSNEAQNALLKVTEEPPANATIILTLEDINNILPTIRSRAFVLDMEPYTVDDLNNYVAEHYSVNDIYWELCDTPGECDTLYNMGENDFVDFVDKVVDNITTVSTANALKILDSLALDKDGDKGYDLALFMKAFIRRCLNVGKDEDSVTYIRMAVLTGKKLSELRIRGINKRMLATSWILEMRSLVEGVK